MNTYKKNSRIVLTSTMITILFILSSCTISSQQPIIEKGTEGLHAKIIAGNNNVLYEKTPADIVVEVENRGTYEVSEGIIKLNVPEQYIELYAGKIGKGSGDKPLYIKGRSIGEPTGETIPIVFNVKTLPLTEESKQQTATISASMCYKYETTASPTVCLQRPGDEKAPCKERTVTLGGQGAPVAVTSVETTLTPAETGNENYIPLITINIRNAGKGTVLSQEDDITSACSSTATEKTKENMISLNAYIDNDGKPLTCGTEEQAITKSIKLKNGGDTTIVCKYEPGIPKSEGTHTSQIIINLKYGYYDITTQNVVIKKT